MLKSIEVQGRTEDEAIELALSQLNLSRDDVSVEILETAKSGLFGLKNTPAIVKVEYESDEPDDADISLDKPSVRNAAAASDAVIDSELTQRIQSYLEGLFRHMDLDVKLDISASGGNVNVALATSDPGVLIGRRGETLDALQHLTNYSVNRSSANRVRVHLDTENYRKRRSEALESLAARTAGKVIKYRRNMTLDPMNAYERHIIHAALQDNNQVSTFSIGNDANRRVVVAYGSNKTAQDKTTVPQFKEWH